MDMNKIYNMDCLEGMKKLPNDSIDLTVTSPPYDKLRKYKGFLWDFKSVAKELYRITKPGGVVVWIVSDSTINGSETGTSFKQALFFAAESSDALYLKKRVVKEYSRRFNVWEVARGLNKTKHPAVFPERLANDHILSWSNKGDVVLDPFCGSGTTAKMAMLTGRKFIGFEISAEYCDIAEKRIASVGKDIPLFEAD